ncbi:MAG TPA: HAD-IIIA family hydrolase [Saprospiraceae bacterium]|nr:HAD-IIIA family hydrolase [Saprospiraceae bacterium]
MIKEAIILSGGLGTRLKEVVPELPKTMAPVAGHPFLTHIIRYLLSKGIEKFIFSLGYKHEVIEDFLENKFPYLNYMCVIEKEPLGTGGAIKFALTKSTERDVLIVNGDTLFKIDIDILKEKHIEEQSECTLALKPMRHFDRYGVVETDHDGRVKRFTEKKFVEWGNINGGIYILNKPVFLKNTFPKIFSFEKDYLVKYVDTHPFYGIVQDKYFVDIGIPSDFERAQLELKQKPLDLSEIDTTWTLFLDRDGVINKNKDDSYVFHPGEFHFLNGALEALAKLNGIFGKIIIVTNQRGIGRGLMDEKMLGEVHQHMLDEITKHGGRIDAVYYCAIDDAKHHDRKPNPGMLLEAAKMYPEIKLSKSIMVGDKMSDMELGRNVGAFTVLIPSSETGKVQSHPDVDLKLDSLKEFAKLL